MKWLLLLALSVPCCAQVAKDAIYVGGTQFSAGTTFSRSGMTVGAGATCLTVGVEWSVPVTAITITWNGVTMTPAAVKSQANGMSAWFYLTNPASGNNTIGGSWTTTADGYATAVSWTGTNTTNCVKTADNATSATTTVTITSGASDATAALMTSSSGAATPTNFTTLFDGNASTNWGAGSYTLGGTSNAHGFGGGGTTSGAGIHIVAPVATPGPNVGFTGKVGMTGKVGIK